MNWQAEFLDNPEIRLTFDHFPFFQKQGIMENRFSFDYQHYDSSEGMPAGDREVVEALSAGIALPLGRLRSNGQRLDRNL